MFADVTLDLVNLDYPCLVAWDIVRLKLKEIVDGVERNKMLQWYLRKQQKRGIKSQSVESGDSSSESLDGEQKGTP